jgi:hypothetical protein
MGLQRRQLVALKPGKQLTPGHARRGLGKREVAETLVSLPADGRGVKGRCEHDEEQQQPGWSDAPVAKLRIHPTTPSDLHFPPWKKPHTESFGATQPG